jgi:hypothetical protein
VPALEAAWRTEEKRLGREPIALTKTQQEWLTLASTASSMS